MEDHQIIDLYWNRDESAIAQTNEKYAAYCRYIASGIVADPEDADECLNDAYLALWNTIPPRRPNNLTAYLGKIVRNVSLNRWKRSNAQKRKSTQIPLTLEELSECIPAANSEEQVPEQFPGRTGAGASPDFHGPLLVSAACEGYRGRIRYYRE